MEYRTQTVAYAGKQKDSHYGAWKLEIQNMVTMQISSWKNGKPWGHQLS